MSDQVDQNHDGQTAEISGTVHLKSHDDAGKGSRNGDDEAPQPEKSSRRKFIIIAVFTLALNALLNRRRLEQQ